MSRKRTGLRNRDRRGAGVSTYAKQRKGSRRDLYGEWAGGRQTTPDVIAGRAMHYRDRVPDNLETGATR